jgi:hypothetical protein
MTILDRNVLALDIAGFLQTLAERNGGNLSSTGWVLSNPITGIAACCARAATGHAAALPIPAMNSRRRTGHASKPLCGQRIAVRVTWERVASRRGANFLRLFCTA